MIFSHNTILWFILECDLFNIDFNLCLLTPYIFLIIHKYLNINPIRSHVYDPVINEQLHSTFVLYIYYNYFGYTHVEVIGHFARVDSFFLHVGSHSSLQSFWQVTLGTDPFSFYCPNIDIFEKNLKKYLFLLWLFFTHVNIKMHNLGCLYIYRLMCLYNNLSTISMHIWKKTGQLIHILLLKYKPDPGLDTTSKNKINKQKRQKTALM